MASSFESFNWEEDERWQQHLNRLEIPNPALLAKAKAKWYKREIDPDFDAGAAPRGRPAPSPPPPTATPQPEASTAEPGSGAAGEPGSTPEPASAARPQTSAPSVGGWAAKLRAALRSAVQHGGGPDRLLFVQHVALIVLFVAYLQPLNRRLSRTAYSQFLLVGVISYLSKVFLRFGAPRTRPFPSALKTWLVQAAATTDLQYAIICGVFTSTRPVMLVCVPTVVLAVYHALSYASTHCAETQPWQQYGRAVHAVLLSKQREAQLLNAGAEVGVGFLVLLNLLTQERNIMLAFLYWQILRTRFHTPDCAMYHRQVWQLIEQRTRPIFDMVPMLHTPIGFMQRWFKNAR